MVSVVWQLAHSLEAGRPGSQEAASDEVFEPSSIQAFQLSSYFTDTRYLKKTGLVNYLRDATRVSTLYL
jgi:hypothetical protein